MSARSASSWVRVGWLSMCVGLTGACGGDSGNPPIDVVGTWMVTYVTCNGTSITSSYVPSGTTLSYRLDGSTLTQTRSANGCTQTTTMPYALQAATFEGHATSNIVVASGSTYAIACTPNSCTGAGLVPPSSCGSNGTNASSATSTVTTFTGSLMTTRESDSQGSAICATYAGAAPFTLSMSKQ